MKTALHISGLCCLICVALAVSDGNARAALDSLLALVRVVVAAVDYASRDDVSLSP